LVDLVFRIYDIACLDIPIFLPSCAIDIPALCISRVIFALFSCMTKFITFSIFICQANLFYLDMKNFLAFWEKFFYNKKCQHIGDFHPVQI